MYILTYFILLPCLASNTVESYNVERERVEIIKIRRDNWVESSINEIHEQWTWPSLIGIEKLNLYLTKK